MFVVSTLSFVLTTLCTGAQVVGIDVLSGCKVRTVWFASTEFLARDAVAGHYTARN
jgi:hypothetical protein